MMGQWQLTAFNDWLPFHQTANEDFDCLENEDSSAELDDDPQTEVNSGLQKRVKTLFKRSCPRLEHVT